MSAIIDRVGFEIIFLYFACAVLFLLLIYIVLCWISTDNEREKIKLMREIRDAAPWADIEKLALVPEYQPILFERSSHHDGQRKTGTYKRRAK